MKRKIMSLTISLALIFACIIPVTAVEQKITFDENTILYEEIAEKTNKVLQFIEPEKALYGLGEVDFSTLYLGKQLPAYTVEKEEMALVSDILYFPIMSGTEWVATAIISHDSAGKMNVQVSAEYAKAYDATDDVNGKIALIFDDTAAYIATENQIVKASVSPNHIQHRESLDSYTGAMNIETVELEADYAVGTLNRYSVQRSSNQYYLQVPCIKQDPGSWQCWAACVASIRGYYGTATTIDNVYDKAGVTKYNGADIYVAANTLNAYGFKTTYQWRGSYNWYQLCTAIDFNHAPIYTSCQTGDKAGHAVVIRGFYVYQNISQVGIISYMDPATGTYVASTVETDGDFYYVASGDVQKYQMVGFLEVTR